MHHDCSDDNPLWAYFMRNGGLRVHNWLNYLEVYHRAFARFRGDHLDPRRMVQMPCA